MYSRTNTKIPATSEFKFNHQPNLSTTTKILAGVMIYKFGKFERDYCFW